MTPAELKALRPGQTIRHKHESHALIVVSNYGDRVTAVRSQDVTNPAEWDLIPTEDKPKPSHFIVTLTRSAMETMKIRVETTLASTPNVAEDRVARLINGPTGFVSLPDGMKVVAQTLSGDEESSWETVDAEAVMP